MCAFIRHRWKQVRQLLGSEAGVSLVEVVAALAILGLVLLPMLEFAAYQYNGQAYDRLLAATLASSKLEELQSESYRTDPGEWPEYGAQTVVIGGRRFSQAYSVVELSLNQETNWMRQATVTVSCTNCKDATSVTVVTYIAKLDSEADSAKLPDPAE